MVFILESRSLSVARQRRHPVGTVYFTLRNTHGTGHALGKHTVYFEVCDQGYDTPPFIVCGL